MFGFALLTTKADPSDADIDAAMSGNNLPLWHLLANQSRYQEAAKD